MAFKNGVLLCGIRGDEPEVKPFSGEHITSNAGNFATQKAGLFRFDSWDKDYRCDCWQHQFPPQHLTAGLFVPYPFVLR